MRDDDGIDKRDVDRPEPRGRKRPYAKPKIREYGSIAKLTQSGGSTKTETGSPRRSGVCL
jgi:hypothetical protein